MSIYKKGVQRRDFDWFAIDSEGINDQFYTVGNWGNAEIWFDYTKLWFYVFDLNLHRGPDKREREATDNMDSELKAKLMVMGCIPPLQVKFTKLMEIADV